MAKKEALPGYDEVCGVSLLVCGESLACYKNDPNSVQYFCFGPKYNEVVLPNQVNKQQQDEAVQECLDREMEFEYE